MRERHELEHGVVCECCLRHVYKGNYTRIAYLKNDVLDSTGIFKTIGRMNLCNNCFEEYTKFLECFMGKNIELAPTKKLRKKR